MSHIQFRRLAFSSRFCLALLYMYLLVWGFYYLKLSLSKTHVVPMYVLTADHKKQETSQITSAVIYENHLKVDVIFIPKYSYRCFVKCQC